MSLGLNEYRVRLINQILSSGSWREVESFCEATVKELEKHKVKGEIALQFIDKLINELELFGPVNNGIQQWTNIQMAKIHLDHIKRSLNEPPIK